MSFYQLILYIHILAAFLFMLCHGPSAFIAFRLRRERELERIRALLDLSVYSFSAMYTCIAVQVVAGIALGFMGHWWGKGWIWAALALLVAIYVMMGLLASQYFHAIRKAAGMPYLERYRPQAAVAPAPVVELHTLLQSSTPRLVAVVGIAGWAIILWLMMVKPF